MAGAMPLLRVTMPGFDPAIIEITVDAAIERVSHGWRAKCLQRLVRMGLPVPTTLSVPVGTVHRIATGQTPDREALSALFGGKTGSVLQQSQCLVSSQKLIKSSNQGNPATKVQLFLDCTQGAADKLAEMGPTGGPTVGSNGVTTVTPTPVVPIQGAPGAGTAPPG